METEGVCQAKMHISAIFTHIDPERGLGEQDPTRNKSTPGMLSSSGAVVSCRNDALSPASLKSGQMIISAIFAHTDPERGEQDSAYN